MEQERLLNEKQVLHDKFGRCYPNGLEKHVLKYASERNGIEGHRIWIRNNGYGNFEQNVYIEGDDAIIKLRDALNEIVERMDNTYGSKDLLPVKN